MAVILGVYGLPLTYLSVQDLPVAVGHSLGPCIFSIKGNITLLFAQHCLQVLFGYSLGGLSITIDMGRYWHLPYFYIPGQFNTNSVLFETAFCMTVYIIVVTLEFAPVWLGFFGLKKWFNKLNKIMFFIIALGALLPMMHQSYNGFLDDCSWSQSPSGMAKLSKHYQFSPC